MSSRYDSGVGANTVGILLTKAAPILIAKAWVTLKGSNRKMEADGTGDLDQAADLLAELFAVIAEEFGVTDPASIVDVDALRALLASKAPQ